MADDSELDYVKSFLAAVHTAHTVATIETVNNVNFINDTQSILVYSGQTIGTSGIIITRQYELQYKDATEGALNAAIYALVAGIKKLNIRTAIAGFTKPNALVGMKLKYGNKTFFNKAGGTWNEKVIIEAEWLTE